MSSSKNTAANTSGQHATQQGQPLNQGAMPTQTTVQREYVQGTVTQDMKAPVVNEYIKQTHIEEVQPIIHREREQTEVRQIMQPMMERDVAPTQTREIETRETKAAIREMPTEQFTNRDINAPHATRTIEDSGVAQKVLNPIVQERVIKNVVEEIQPVVNREVVQNEVIHHTHHVYEKIQEAPILVAQTREPIIVQSGSATAPLAGQQGMMQSTAQQHSHSDKLQQGTQQPMQSSTVNKPINQ